MSLKTATYKLRLPVYKNRGWGYPYDNFVQLQEVPRDRLLHQPHNSTANTDIILVYHPNLTRILGPWGNEFYEGDKTTALPSNYGNYVPHLNNYQEFRDNVMQYDSWRIHSVTFQIETKFPRNEPIVISTSNESQRGTSIETPLSNPVLHYAYPQSESAVIGLLDNFIDYIPEGPVGASVGAEITTGEATALQQLRFPDVQGMYSMKNCRKKYLRTKKTYSFPLNFVSYHYPIQDSQNIPQGGSWGAIPMRQTTYGMAERRFNDQKRWMMTRDVPHTWTHTSSDRYIVHHLAFDTNYSTYFRIANIPSIRNIQESVTADDVEMMFQFYIIVKVMFKDKIRNSIGDYRYIGNYTLPTQSGSITQPFGDLSAILVPSVGETIAQSAGSQCTTHPGAPAFNPDVMSGIINVSSEDAIKLLAQTSQNFSGVQTLTSAATSVVQLFSGGT